MSRSLLHLVLHHAEGFAGGSAEPDSELLARFARSRDEAAFAELVRRHASMVWAVCRQSLAGDADAEDAFQATFLALVRSAKRVKDGRALAGWLHGVAVRVALKTKRSAARQRLREHRVATREAERPVPEAAWNELLAAVHEEVQRLPDSLRTAFVLCELEGVRQGEASERLGWKPGTLTGRLTRARQMLIERLARRGLAPAVAGGSLGVGVATAAAEVPHRLIDTALSLTQAGGAVSPAVLKLASEGLPMMMRTKLAAGLLVVAGGLSAVLYPMASAQVREAPAIPRVGASESPPLPPPAATVPGKPLPPRANTPPLNPDGYPATPPVVRPPRTPEPAPLAAPQYRDMAVRAQVRQQWEYKFVLGGFEAANVGDLFEKLGNDGWELCGSFALAKDRNQKLGNINVAADGSNTLVIFKRPKAVRGVAVHPSSGVGNPLPVLHETLDRNFKPATGYTPPVAAITPPSPSATTARLSTPVAGGPPAPELPGLTPPERSLTPPAAVSPSEKFPLTVIKLKHAPAGEIALTLSQVYGSGKIGLTASDRSNSIIIRTDAKTLSEIKKLLEELDVPSVNKTGPATPDTSNPAF